MKFCDKLPKLRKEQNLSQEQLADKLGISRQAVSKWESGLSYPDMEKILQLCKILNCSLDDLIDNSATGNNQFNSTKPNLNYYLKEILDFVTKTANMFYSMRLIQKIKCLLEMGFIILLIFLTWLILGTLIWELLSNVFNLLPYIIYRIIYSLCHLFYGLLGLIIGIILSIHLFKIRYLDYFLTIEDNSTTPKNIEQPLTDFTNKQQVFTEKKKEKIIIRDPRHSTYRFFYILAKFVLYIIKLLLLLFLCPCLLLFIMLSFGIVISLWLIPNGGFFIGTTISLIGAILITFTTMLILYNFLFNRKQKLNTIFILAIISFTAIGVGLGLSFINYLTFTKIDTINQQDYIQTTKYINMQENLLLTIHPQPEMLIDETIDNIKIEINHSPLTTISLSDFPIEQCFYNENPSTATCQSDYYTYSLELVEKDYLEIINQIIKDFQNKERKNYESIYNYQVKIYANSENIAKLNQNYQTYFSN